MLNRIRFAFVAGLCSSTSPFAVKAEVLDTITDAPSSIFQLFRGVLASDAAKQDPVPVEVVGRLAPKPRHDRRRCYPRASRSAMSKRDAYGAPKSPTICTNCDL